MSMNFSAALCVLLTLGSISVPVVIAAELSIEQAIKRTLTLSPLLQQYPVQQRLDDATRIQASVTANPELNMSLENALGSGDNRGITSAELTISLSQLIELGDKRDARLAVSEWRSQLSQQQYEIDKADTAASTLRAYLHLLYLQALQALAADNQHAERQALSIARQRATAGTVSDADISRLEYRLLQSQSNTRLLQAEQVLARQRLAANWAGTVDFDRVSGTLSSQPGLPALHQLQTQLQRAPQLQWWLTQQRLQQSQLQLAIAMGKSDITLGGGVRRSEASNDTSLVLQFSMPLSINNTNQGNILAARAQAEKTALQQQQQHQLLQLQVQQLYQQLAMLQQQVDDYKQAIIPAAEKVLGDMLQGYQRGLFDMTDLLAAQKDILSCRRTVIDLTYRLNLQLTELERLTGLSLVAVGPQRVGTAINKEFVQ